MVKHCEIQWNDLKWKRSCTSWANKTEKLWYLPVNWWRGCPSRYKYICDMWIWKEHFESQHIANSNLEIRLNKKKPCLKLETGGKNSVLNQPLNVISFRYPSWHEFLNHPHYPGWSLFHSWITWAAYASILFDLSHIWCKLALSCAQSMFMASALVNKSPKYLKITNPCIFSGQNPYNENPKRATISWEITGSHITNSSPFVISRSWQCMWLLLHGTSCHQNQSKRPKRRLCQKGIIKTFPLELRHIKHCKMFLDLQLEKINKNLEKNMSVGSKKQNRIAPSFHLLMVS